MLGNIVRRTSVAARVVVIGGATCLSLSAWPAHAAVGGTIAAGPGSNSCETTVTCASFRVALDCARAPEDNDVDASVRSAAGLAGAARTFRWSATSAEVPPAKQALVIAFYNSNCTRLPGDARATAATTSVSVPAAASWIVVYPTQPFAQASWSLS